MPKPTPHKRSISNGKASLLGSVFAGYEVRALIGRGATGTVYLAHDLALDRPVALKVLLGALARNPASVHRFHREARAAAPLRNPSIVRVYSAGMDEGIPYIAMEYVPGEPLDRYWRRNGHVPWKTALYIGIQMAKALECAHAAGIVHRDVKPANILLDRQGRVRLTDFGIANIAVPTDGSKSCQLVGTPHYLSPEQCAGLPASPLSDLYALGVTLYEIMAGRTPHQGATPVAVFKKIMEEEPPRLNRIVPEIPDDVARVVAHLMEKEPGQRPADATAVLAVMERLLAENGGRSAIPEALAEYVKEQAANRSIRVIPTPVNESEMVRGDTPHDLRKPEPGRIRRTAFVALALAGFGAFSLWALSRGTAGAAPLPAPSLPAFTVSSPAPGVTLGRLAVPMLRIRDLSWISSQHPVLGFVAEGRPGSYLEGSRGLASINVESGHAYSLLAPRSVLSNTAAGSLEMPGMTISPWTTMTDSSSLRDALVMYAVSAEPEGSDLSVYAQRWNEAHPFARGGETYRVGNAAEPSIAMHPQGTHICIASQEAGHATLRVHARETATREKALEIASAHTIIPGSVLYDPTGSRIAYIRSDAAGKQALWIVKSDGSEANGRPISLGESIEPSFAFSPDGKRIAVAIRGAQSRRPEVRVVNVESGETIRRLGMGYVARQAWHPNGRWILVARADDERPLHLVLTDFQTGSTIATPASGYAVTSVAGAISPDGTHAAAVADDSEPALLIIQLDSNRSTVEGAEKTAHGNPDSGAGEIDAHA
ncbi:MAG: hypothetical protein AMXMBFR84_10660 [Candidatus Hydrogenedentota bacterium]